MTPIYTTDNPIENLLRYLNSRMELSPTFNPDILPMLHSSISSEKQVFAKPGDTLRTAVWLEDAYGQSYKMVFDKDDLPVKLVIDYFPPKSIMLDSLGFFNNEPTDCFYEILPNATIVPFDHSHFEELKLTAPEAEALANRILAEMLKLKDGRMTLKNLHGIDRYRQFIVLYGRLILQAYPQNQIALFLGFTPEHLNYLICSTR